MTDEMRRTVDKLTTSVSLRSFVRLYSVSLCTLIDTIKVTIYTLRCSHCPLGQHRYCENSTLFT